MESIWTMFKASILDAAALSCGHWVIGVCHGSNLRTHLTPAVKEALRLKNQAF